MYLSIHPFSIPGKLTYIFINSFISYHLPTGRCNNATTMTSLTWQRVLSESFFFLMWLMSALCSWLHRSAYAGRREGVGDLGHRRRRRHCLRAGRSFLFLSLLSSAFWLRLPLLTKGYSLLQTIPPAPSRAFQDGRVVNPLPRKVSSPACFAFI